MKEARHLGPFKAGAQTRSRSDEAKYGTVEKCKRLPHGQDHINCSKLSHYCELRHHPSGAVTIFAARAVSAQCAAQQTLFRLAWQCTRYAGAGI